jgi:tetratricopeptide (TPR) repeat protein
MSWSAGRWVVMAACLVLLGGCETSTKLSDLISRKSDDPTSTGLLDHASAEPATTGSVAAPPDAPPPDAPYDAATATMLGSDPSDDLALGKKQYRAGNFGLAERYFRRAVELHPNDAEAWLGLAAAYDRLRRFDLADRAYQSASAIIGPTVEILNNRGFSYMLRGDYVHARETLLAAAARDPKNPYVRNNLQLLDKSFRNGKAVQ